MKKLVILSALMFLLASCDISIQKEGANIKAMYFDNVPSTAIKIAEFDKAGILLHVDYSDKTNSEFPVTESWLPKEYLHYLGEPGTYSVSILFRGRETKLNFTMVANDSAPAYNVTFYNRDGEVADKYAITHRKDAVFHGCLEEVNGYRFVGWDQSLYGISADTEFHPIYEACAY